MKWQIGWGITNACNMKCNFCYSVDCRVGDNILPMSVLCNFVDENSYLIDSINFGTGENSLVQQWYDLIQYIKDKYPGIPMAITTNGNLGDITERDSQKRSITRKAISEIDVSLDFIDEARHNEIRGNKNAFSWVLKTLKFCKENGIKATIVMIGIEETMEFKNLEGIFTLAHEYNAMVRLNIFRPNRPYLNSAPSPHLVYKVISWLVEQYEIANLSDPLFSSIFYYDGINEDASGISSLRILPNGWITPSTYLISDHWHTENIKNGTVLEKIGTSDIFSVFRKECIPVFCSDCSIRDRCKGGTKDRRFLHYRTLAEPDPFCPFRQENAIDINTLPQVNAPRNKQKVSIHDGYLPTLIFHSSKVKMHNTGKQTTNQGSRL